ncbi:MAG: TolC family protein [Sphingobacteriales bacterium]|nr:TolC family protein [Sphingobacteriales bacterium]
MKLTSWLNKSVTVIYLVLSSLFRSEGQELQKISLDSIQAAAHSNYPLLKQKDLIRKTEQTSLQNLNKGYLPQVSVNSQATYQSDVTQIDVPLPGILISAPDKDQYKATADFNQVLFDGGLINQQKIIQRLNAETENQKVEVELYKLKERVNLLYLNILFLDQQQKQIELIKNDLKIGAAKLKAQVENGVAFRSNLDIINAELLKTEQRNIELVSSREGLVNALKVISGRNLSQNVELEQPTNPIMAVEINRPELRLFDKQSELIKQQSKLTAAKILPKASLFGQGGYGRPGLNMLKNEFDWFYIAGARLTWNLSSLYTSKGENKLIDISQQNVLVQKDAFILNTQIQLQQQNSEITKLQKLVDTDTEIIALREKVKNAAKAQLENGVITASDYLREVNADDQARQAQITHRLQLLQAQINFQNISGK